MSRWLVTPGFFEDCLHAEMCSLCGHFIVAVLLCVQQVTSSPLGSLRITWTRRTCCGVPTAEGSRSPSTSPTTSSRCISWRDSTSLAVNGWPLLSMKLTSVRTCLSSGEGGLQGGGGGGGGGGGRCRLSVFVLWSFGLGRKRLQAWTQIQAVSVSHLSLVSMCWTWCLVLQMAHKQKNNLGGGGGGGRAGGNGGYFIVPVRIFYHQENSSNFFLKTASSDSWDIQHTIYFLLLFYFLFWRQSAVTAGIYSILFTFYCCFIFYSEDSQQWQLGYTAYYLLSIVVLFYILLDLPEQCFFSGLGSVC